MLSFYYEPHLRGIRKRERLLTLLFSWRGSMKSPPEMTHNCSVQVGYHQRCGYLLRKRMSIRREKTNAFRFNHVKVTIKG